jgi:glycine/D-amino acid oxidase-like deaminating enzyme
MNVRVISPMADTSNPPPSLWAATAIAGPDCPPLESDADCDVAIIGAGFTGLTAALAASEAGASVVLLEAGEPGWGVSGRNGGQVNAGMKIPPSETETKFGKETSGKFNRFAGGAAVVVFSLIEKHNIDCEARRGGLLFCVAQKGELAPQRKVATEWAERGAPVRWADADEITALSGANGYLGGMVDMRCGRVQPLSYARGLAHAAVKAGARICGHTMATGLTRIGTHWQIATPNGSVNAGKVILATNAYTGIHASGLSRPLARSIVPIASFIIATEPLSENLRKSILPGGHCTADTRRFLYYTSIDDAGRQVFGGRGLLRDPRGERDFAHLHAGIAEVFPQVKGVDITFRWSGRLAVTMDKVPHVHEPEPGLLMALGYNGRGVAAASALGTGVGTYAWTGDDAALPFPISGLNQIPFHGARAPFMAAAFSWYIFMDKIVK